MRTLFVMDPLHKIQVAGDSTYVVMRECCDRGYQVFMCEPTDLFAEGGRAHATVTAVNVTADAPYFVVGGQQELCLDTIQVVWMRKDPPFDMAYIFCTYLLDMTDGLVVNDPIGLKVFNEKLWAMRFVDLHPPTLLSQDMDRLQAFVEAQPGRAVLKPWDGNGGRGVLVTQAGDRNLRSMLELLTVEGKEFVLAQPYLDKVDEGDKRILLFDGEPVGAMLRIPTAGDFRGNMHVGATVQPCDLSQRDQEICDTLGPHLRKHGQTFVGIDVIDGWLTEINITSPTGIREINVMLGKKLEADLVDRVMARARAKERT
ncbi:MAG: glutathione synthase [Kiritimatiellia bacterium]|jgi:glutathione synthase